MNLIPDFVINMGKFEKQGDTFRFEGKEIEWNNPVTGTSEKRTANGDILFASTFQKGTISFDITFDNVFNDTRAGVILNYKNINGHISEYQVGIRNLYGGYSIDYFNGKSWEFKAFGGPADFIQCKTKYSIKAELQGNSVHLYVNNVKVIEYTGLTDIISGACGLFVVNGAGAVIENIEITTQKPSVFCIMKFERDFDDLYRDVINPQCEKMGFCTIRADECYQSSAIIQDIIREISNASVVICDITMDNPNVFYELGYAHALQKPTILLADVNKRAQLPFDVSGYRTIFYSNTIAGKKDIEPNIRKYIKNILEGSPFPTW